MQTPSVTPASAAACTRKPRKARPAHLPFPRELPDPANRTPLAFWLGTWKRNLMMQEELKAFFRTTAAMKAKQKNMALYTAMTRTETEAEQSVRNSIKYLTGAGGLLFAFAESHKRRQGGAIC